MSQTEMQTEKKKERKKHTNSPEKNIQEVWDNF